MFLCVSEVYISYEECLLLVQELRFFKTALVVGTERVSTGLTSYQI